MTKKKVESENTTVEKKAGLLKRAQLDAQRVNEKGEADPITWLGRVLVHFRLRAMKLKVFTSTYWNNDEALKKFVADNPVIILSVRKEDNPTRKFDHHLKGTEAMKQRVWKVHYVEENSYTTKVLGFSKKVEHFRLGIFKA